MKLYLRLLLLLLTQRFRSRCKLTGPATTTLRVYPNDLDVFGHVNNGVYLTYADLARTDLMLRSGSFRPMMNKGWYPVVLAETIRFYRSLKLFQKVDITTRVLGWDERNFYLEQQFYRNGVLYAVAAITSRFLSRKGGSVGTAELLELVDHNEPSPVLPDWVADWDKTRVELDALVK